MQKDSSKCNKRIDYDDGVMCTYTFCEKSSGHKDCCDLSTKDKKQLLYYKEEK